MGFVALGASVIQRKRTHTNIDDKDWKNTFALTEEFVDRVTLVPISGTSEKRLLCVHAFETLSFLPRTLSKVRVIIVAAMVNVMKTLKT